MNWWRASHTQGWWWWWCFIIRSRTDTLLRYSLAVVASLTHIEKRALPAWGVAFRLSCCPFVNGFVHSSPACTSQTHTNTYSQRNVVMYPYLIIGTVYTRSPSCTSSKTITDGHIMWWGNTLEGANTKGLVPTEWVHRAWKTTQRKRIFILSAVFTPPHKLYGND